MNQSQVKTVTTLLETNRNPIEISRRLHVSPTEVRSLMSDELEPIFGWGRVTLQRHIISRRRLNSPCWPPEDSAVLHEHRRLHDQGKVTMCQGRDGDYIIQYAMISKGNLRRRAYFYGGS